MKKMITLDKVTEAITTDIPKKRRIRDIPIRFGFWSDNKLRGVLATEFVNRYIEYDAQELLDACEIWVFGKVNDNWVHENRIFFCDIIYVPEKSIEAYVFEVEAIAE